MKKTNTVLISAFQLGRCHVLYSQKQKFSLRRILIFDLRGLRSLYLVSGSRVAENCQYREQE